MEAIKVYTTDIEKEEIKNAAEAVGMSVSNYLKSTHNKSNLVLIKTNDLTDYTAVIYDLNQKIQGILATIRRTDSIYPQDAARIESLLTDINDKSKIILETVYKMRKKAKKC